MDLAVSTPARSEPAVPARRGFRTDIEGLRAFAVGGVLLFHAGLSFVPGGYVGVDVFFVISGFLITGMLHRELVKTGRISFSKFYARRIKRLLPASATVLLVTAIGSAIFLPALQRVSAGHAIVSAALYVINWSLARQQSDYLNPSVAPSPVQHYWSLAVEEQYYVVWPLLLALVMFFALRRRLALRPVMFATLATLGLASFLLSLHQTTANQPYAFFGTPSRVWELALGGCIALGLPLIERLAGSVRAVIGWAGLVALVGSMLVLDAATPFPGTAALWPVLGAGAVIASGVGPAPRGPGAVLTLGPIRHIGRISYSWYLWHWPPLVLAAAWLGHDLTAWEGTLVVAATWLPAYLSWRYLEEPFRKSDVLVQKPRRAYGLAAVLTAVGAVAGLLLVAGASNATTTVVDPQGKVVKVDPAAARKDLPIAYSDGCRAEYAATTAHICHYADTKSPNTVALFGDSHALQWQPAFVDIAKSNGWGLDLAVKTGCSPADIRGWDPVKKREYTECSKWRDSTIAALTTGPDKPDVVVISQRDSYQVTTGSGPLSKSASDPIVQAGLERTYKKLTDAGIKVVVLGNEPEPGRDIPDCISAHIKSPATCNFPRNLSYNPNAPDRAAAAASGLVFIDPAKVVCPKPTCAVVNRGTIVYRDLHHLTATYVKALEPELRKLFSAAGVAALGQKPAGGS